MSMKLAAGLFILSLSLGAGCIDHSGDAPPIVDARSGGDQAASDTPADGGGGDMPATDGAATDRAADGGSDASTDAAIDGTGDGGAPEVNADADLDAVGVG
jgi:hypothetical protein